MSGNFQEKNPGLSRARGHPDFNVICNEWVYLVYMVIKQMTSLAGGYLAVWHVSAVAGMTAAGCVASCDVRLSKQSLSFTRQQHWGLRSLIAVQPQSPRRPTRQTHTKVKIKVRTALYVLETHHRATERHLPYGITQVLPATRHRWTRPPLTPAMQAGTRFTYPGGMEGWVDLGGWLYAEIWDTS